MCDPVTATGVALSVGGAVMQNKQAGRNAAATQAELDRQTDTSRELFDDRNTRLIDANADQMGLASSEYDLRSNARRDTQDGVAEIVGDALNTQARISSETRSKRASIADGYNNRLDAERTRQSGYQAEGEGVVDDLVGKFDFGTREAQRAGFADRRNATAQGNITGPGEYIETDDPYVRAALEKSTAAGVQKGRDIGTADARVGSYRDSLQQGEEDLAEGGDAYERVRARAEGDLRVLDADLSPYATAFASAEKLGREDIERKLAEAEREVGYKEASGTRIIDESLGYETGSAGIIDNYVGSMNASSTAYQDALRQTASMRLANQPQNSAVGSLFSTLGGAATAAGGPGSGKAISDGFGKVGSYLKAATYRPPSGASNFLPRSF
jgi:hypothetical protein